MLILTLPYPPTANHLHAVVNGRKVLSRAGRLYYEAVADTVRRQMRDFAFQPFDSATRLHYRLDVFPPDRRRRDLSNVVKAFEDALTKAGVWADDSQVDLYSVRRCAPLAGGRLSTQVMVMDELQA